MPILAFALLAALPLLPAFPWAERHSTANPAAPGWPAETDRFRAEAGLFSMSVAIRLPGASVEPNAPFLLEAIPSGGGGSEFRFQWNDSLGVDGSNRTITLFAPASGSVEAHVTAEDGFGDVARASASVGVGEAPSIAVSSAIGATDAGLPIPLTMEVNGSFPPFTLDWSPLPVGPASSSVLAGPGTFEVATTQDAPGYAWIRATVTDRGSAASTIDAVVAVVHPRPQALLVAVEPAIDAGSVALATGLVDGGTPPFSWTAQSSLPVSNVTGANGSVGASGTIAWSGRFAAWGNATVRLQIADSVGVLLVAETTFRVYPPLAPVLAIGTRAPASGAPLNLSGTVAGGLGPYEYSWTLSDGEQASGSIPSAGPILWVAHPTTVGFLTVRLTVVDLLAGQATAISTLFLDPGIPAPAAADPPSGSPAPPSAAPKGGTAGAAWEAPVGLAVVLTVGAVALAWEWRRRRQRVGSPAPSSNRNAETVAGLLRDPEGTELAALQLLAESEGLSTGEFEAAVRSLETAGKVRVDRSEEGSALVRWVGGSPPPPTSGREP